MKTIYLTRTFQPVVVTAVVPGDLHADPVHGDCRRLTARRLCLAAERMGKESDAFLALLGAIDDVTERGVYDGREVADWYGLVGLAAPKMRAPELVKTVCPKCKATHFALEEEGGLWNGGVCGECLDLYTPYSGPVYSGS